MEEPNFYGNQIREVKGFDKLNSLILALEHRHASIAHKLNRIKQQEIFKIDHAHQFMSLTKRELEIMQLLVDGSSNPQIADQLCISRNTVEQHRKNINRKLEIRSAADLFHYGLAFDLI